MGRRDGFWKLLRCPINHERSVRTCRQRHLV
jgi:hypothetical protein